jgi:predicted phage terminase large subunit-like protein
MESTKYRSLFDVSIRKDSDGKLMFHTNQGGQFIIVSKGESISGIRANLIKFDDIVGGAKEARSVIERESAWSYVTMDLLTREDKTHKVKIVGVGTRWHKEDVLCRLEGHEAFKDVKIVKFKAINDEGKALWPERHNEKDLMLKKMTLGSQAFQALYQQEPTSEEGSIIRRGWIKHYREKPSRFDEIIQSWDAAFGKSENSDFVVGVVMGRVGSEFYLLDMVRARMDFPETKKAIKSLSAKWPATFRKVMEKKANGAALIDDLAKEVMGLIPYVPKESKESRASSVSALFEAGNVYFPDPSLAPWVHDMIEEIVNFPNHGNDDMVDAVVQALIHLRENANWITGMIKR